MDVRIQSGQSEKISTGNRQAPVTHASEQENIGRVTAQSIDGSEAKQKEAEVEKKLEHLLDINYQSLQFSFDKDKHQIHVKVVDQQTGKIVREIPPDKVVKMLAQLQNLAGMWVDFHI